MPVQHKTVLNDFLNRVNYITIYLLPYNNNAQILAALARNGRRFQRLTGKGLMKRNIIREAKRLHIRRQHIIYLATNQIWNMVSTTSQRNRFNTLAENANHINRTMNDANNNTLDRISQITMPQATNNLYEANFFNGTSFP
ncbi:16511_t:CDS:1 [Funneliformis caledonium]|uniref:16511_t:CDS:1 n=1 Tax=Funneliformis caledonium TaxID=1117310 RepID=A0A9N8V4B8_9GLOM|nr:16511_t:CDS:1 [Funneliformis caledonium]